MMKLSPQKTPATLTSTARALLTGATTLLMLIALGLLINYFYAMTALLGFVLIITYILLGPVNLMEYGINALSALTRRIPAYNALIQRSPEANPRILAVMIVYTFFLLTITIGSIKFAPILSNQVGDMSQKIGVQLLETSDQALTWADQNIGNGALRHIFAQTIRQAEVKGVLKHHISPGKPVTREERKVIQKTVIQSTLTQLETALSNAVPALIALMGGTVNGFIYLLAGLILSYYFLADGHRIKSELLLIFPVQARQTTDYLLKSFHDVMFAFIKGQVLLGLLTGTYMTLVYSLFHVPYAFLLGCIFAAAELLPVVGTWIGIGIGLCVILLNMPPIVAGEVWLCSYCYQTLKDNILAPKVVGDVMGLHPLVIILSLMICAQVAGLLGVLLALPLASAINVIIRLLLDVEAAEKAEKKSLKQNTTVEAAGHAG